MMVPFSSVLVRAHLESGVVGLGMIFTESAAGVEPSECL